MCYDCKATIAFITGNDSEWFTTEHLLANMYHIGHHNEELMRNGWCDEPPTSAQVAHVTQQVQIIIACESEMKTRLFHPPIFRPQ